MDKVQIKQYLEYEESEILALYKEVGWKNYYEKPNMLKQAYNSSLCIMGAYLDSKLVGIIRVVGDGSSIIYIQDLVVSPLQQRTGIGSLLLNTIMEKYSAVYQKVLLTDNNPKTVKFYESMGFNSVDKYGGIGLINYTI